MPTTHPSAAEVLRRVPLFADLSETEIKFLAERAVPRRYAPGELVFAEGDACPGLFVIERGNVRLFTTSTGGREQVLTIEKAGNSIAELPVFDGGNSPASAAAVEDAQLLFVSKQDFHSLCLVHPKVALKVLRVVGSRLRTLVGIIEELSFTTVRSRLISLLVRLAGEQARARPAECRSRCRPPTRNWQRTSARCANWCRATSAACRRRDSSRWTAAR